MKTIGLIGGMSWESTVPYYRQINEVIKTRLGGFHSAKVLLYSVDFAEVEHFQVTGQWDAAGALLADAAQRLERAGADGLVLCTNTMHRVADAITAAVHVPLLHIADATAQQIKDAGIGTVGLLGTRFTMEQAFYKSRLQDNFGLRVLTPDEAGRDVVHRVIYDELVMGKIVPASREAYRAVMAQLVAAGAQCIIAGCTEITLLVGAADTSVPMFDTTAIHAMQAAEWMLSEAG
jgi:aspartate racemase